MVPADKEESMRRISYAMGFLPGEPIHVTMKVQEGREGDSR